MLGVFAFALKEHVGLANCISLGVDLLPIEVCADLLASRFRNCLKTLLSNSQHATRATSAIVDQVRAGFDLIGNWEENEVRHQFDGIARSPVFASLFIIL